MNLSVWVRRGEGRKKVKVHKEKWGRWKQMRVGGGGEKWTRKKTGREPELRVRSNGALGYLANLPVCAPIFHNDNVRLKVLGDGSCGLW